MDCRINLTTSYKNGKSYMKDLYVTPPFRVVSVGQTQSDDGEYLMVMSTSPGVLNEDHYGIDIQVEENARLQLQSQSYQRLFNMDVGATQEMNINLEKNTSFFYVPHPVVPHENSTFRSISKINISENCSLLLSEIITCGRKHYGEIFKFKHFQNLVEIYKQGTLVLKDNILIQPSLMKLSSIGQMEDFTHQGTLIYMNTKGKSTKEMIEYLFSFMGQFEGIEFGISATQKEGFILRVLGHHGEQMYDCFKKIQELIWQEEI